MIEPLTFELLAQDDFVLNLRAPLPDEIGMVMDPLVAALEASEPMTVPVEVLKSTPL